VGIPPDSSDVPRLLAFPKATLVKQPVRRVTPSRRLIQRGLWVEYASVAWMTIECLAAIYSGIVVWSLALLAFGGDSLVELLSSLAVVQHLRNALTGSEGERETKRTELATAFLLFSLIPVIGVAAVYSFLIGIRPESSPLGITVAIAAIVIMPVLWYQKKRIGKASKCLPLTIDAAESATCFWMSAALLAGLTINFVWKVPWVDYAATVVILGFVAKEAIEAIHEVL
jgi:divalent metal cation (Fe/Co/Zn/Cd) transporter